MQDIFITKIKINEVRHVKDFEINLSETERKHLIITGKNGSGKTSVLYEIRTRSYPLSELHSKSSSVFINYSPIGQQYPLAKCWNDGEFIFKYFEAKRNSELVIPNGPHKIDFKSNYNLDEKFGNYFTQHIVNLQFDKLFAKQENNFGKAEHIDKWFTDFEKTLADLFDEPELKLVFDSKNYNFQISQNGNPPFSFNQLSDGYSAVLDIITELIMRMEEHKTKSYDVQGIVLIDEIETHLHIDLQKKILPFLTSFFPKIQFIVTTHSPFVLSSIKNTVICDLETRVVTEDLSGYSWGTLVESYFDSDQYSEELKEKVAEYERLLNNDNLTEAEKDELLELKIYFSKVPTVFSDELAIKLNELNLKAIAKNK